MDDATPEESKPKGIKPANLTAIIIAAVAVALSGIGGGYAYWTHHESTRYHAAGEQAGRVAGVAARFREGCQFQTTNNMPMTLR